MVFKYISLKSFLSSVAISTVAISSVSCMQQVQVDEMIGKDKEKHSVNVVESRGLSEEDHQVFGYFNEKGRHELFEENMAFNDKMREKFRDIRNYIFGYNEMVKVYNQGLRIEDEIKFRSSLCIMNIKALEEFSTFIQDTMGPLLSGSRIDKLYVELKVKERERREGKIMNPYLHRLLTHCNDTFILTTLSRLRKDVVRYSSYLLSISLNLGKSEYFIFLAKLCSAMDPFFNSIDAYYKSENCFVKDNKLADCALFAKNISFDALDNIMKKIFSFKNNHIESRGIGNEEIDMLENKFIEMVYEVNEKFVFYLRSACTYIVPHFKSFQEFLDRTKCLDDSKSSVSLGYTESTHKRGEESNSEISFQFEEKPERREPEWKEERRNEEFFEEVEEGRAIQVKHRTVIGDKKALEKEEKNKKIDGLNKRKEEEEKDLEESSKRTKRNFLMTKQLLENHKRSSQDIEKLAHSMKKSEISVKKTKSGAKLTVPGARSISMHKAHGKSREKANPYIKNLAMNLMESGETMCEKVEKEKEEGFETEKVPFKKKKNKKKK